jgi:hypothetical protein
MHQLIASAYREEASVYCGRPTMFRDRPVQFLVLLALVPVFGRGLIFLLVWYLRVRCTLFEPAFPRSTHDAVT